MELLRNHPLLLFPVYVVLCAMLTGTIWGILILIGAKKKKRYEEDYQTAETFVLNWIVNDRNFEIINKLFSEMFHNNQDEGKTDELWFIFKDKYREQFTKRDLKEQELVNQTEKV